MSSGTKFPPGTDAAIRAGVELEHTIANSPNTGSYAIPPALVEASVPTHDRSWTEPVTIKDGIADSVEPSSSDVMLFEDLDALKPGTDEHYRGVIKLLADETVTGTKALTSALDGDTPPSVDLTPCHLSEGVPLYKPGAHESLTRQCWEASRGFIDHPPIWTSRATLPSIVEDGSVLTPEQHERLSNKPNIVYLYTFDGSRKWVENHYGSQGEDYRRNKKRSLPKGMSSKHRRLDCKRHFICTMPDSFQVEYDIEAEKGR